MLKNYITRNVNLTNLDVESKRAEILKYFTTTYELFEKLFETFENDDVYYNQPEPLRHQMIFYYGHTSTFFINKLVLGKFLSKRINSQYESLFSVGVDEMSWDDLNKEHYDWPSVQETKAYRTKAKEVVIDYIKNCEFTLPITWSSPMWPIIMGIEHEKIHVETSSVLHRQIDIDLIKADSFGQECKEYGSTPINELINVPASTIKIGIEKNHEYYGWDNEYGQHEENIESFNASKYLVSNGEFLEFVIENGYSNDEFWSAEGLAWKKYRGAAHPIFWIKNGESYKYRTMTNIIDLPLNWPVDTNYLEAEAFCNWKSKKTNKNITLPSEGMWHSLVNFSNFKDEPFWDGKPNANINLEHYSSSCPVDKFKTGDFYDVVGNVWQWTTTAIDGFKGFEIHPLYDDFSVPTFDNRHNIFKGGSWASTGNETLINSRYAFRRHFPQHAGFRYIEMTQQDNTIKNSNKEDIVDQNKEAYIKAAQFAILHAENKNRALNLGCYFGSSSIELAKGFKEVIGVDFTARNVINAEQQKNQENSDNCEFWQGDSCNLKEHLTSFDLILATNNLEELYNTDSFVNTIENRLNKNGIFILQSVHNQTSDSLETLLSEKLTKIQDNVWKKI
ncbi:5-histidylcysteine sulfoxide synthase [Arcobacter sp. 31_11_sub10_T18]|nr:5-histidylcysteine sulfoxide synthase [Arcobacter sp. 31_11_sub10_T18]